MPTLTVIKYVQAIKNSNRARKLTGSPRLAPTQTRAKLKYRQTLSLQLRWFALRMLKGSRYLEMLFLPNAMPVALLTKKAISERYPLIPEWICKKAHG